MTLPRLLPILLLAALLAASARASQDGAVDEPTPPRRGSRTESLPAPASAPAPRLSMPQRYDARDRRIELLRSRYQMPREISQDMHRAILDAQNEHGGKVLSADRMHSDGRDIFRVKLLTSSGRVRVVQVPSREPSPTPNGREQQGEQ